jgi:putative transcriptional regulator
MTKRVFDDIAEGLREAISIAKGEADPATYRIHIPPSVDVKTIRSRRRLTQKAFAERYGFSPAAVRDWEQNRRNPDPAARTLLLVIDREPEAVERALAAACR